MYAEECGIWSERNGGETGNVIPETVTKAYEEAWLFTLNPPPPPMFKTREQLAAQDIDERGLEAPILYSSTSLTKDMRLETRRMSDEEHIASHANDSEIVQKYYAQFPDYIKQHLDRLCTAKALSNAQDAGLARLTIEHQPKQAWTVAVQLNMPHPMVSNNGTISVKGYVLQMPEGKFGFVGLDGSFKYLNKPASVQDDDWFLQKSVLRSQALGGLGDKYKVLASSSPAPSSVKGIIEQQVRKNVIAAIEDWKNNNYNPSFSESLLRAIIPFYETAHKLVNDKDYKLRFEDVAWDLFDLGLTVASIGASVGITKMATVGLRAAKAMQGTSIAMRAAQGLQAALGTIKKGKLLYTTGRELADFVVPVFSAPSLVRAGSQGSLAVVRAGLGAAIKKMDSISVANVPEILDRIYNVLPGRYVKASTMDAAACAEKIATGAAQAIPPQLFRGQTVRGEHNILASTKWRTVDETTGDDYLADIIQHSARLSGSGGEVLSMSMDHSVATRFASNRDDSRILAIDTTAHPENFRTIEDILKNDGPRLVQAGKIRIGTLRSAIAHAINQQESEVFYMLGSIPDELITIRPREMKRVMWG